MGIGASAGYVPARPLHVKTAAAAPPVSASSTVRRARTPTLMAEPDPLQAVLANANLLAINWDNLKFQSYDSQYGSLGAPSAAAAKQTLTPIFDDTTVILALAVIFPVIVTLVMYGPK